MGWFDSFFHPERAYKKAEEPVNQAYNEAKGYQDPYFQQGQAQYQRLNDATGALLNPVELENRWAQSYEQSPYAQQLLRQNQEAGQEAASAMGLGGSSAALGNIQTGAGNIVSQDREKFMKDLMEKYLAGIGLGQNIYGQGAAAGTNLSNLATGHGTALAGLEYGRQAAPGQLFGRLLGAGAGLAANYATGGAYGAMPEYAQNAIFNAGNKYNQ